MSKENEYTELAKKFAESTDKVKEVAEELQGKMENGEKLLQSTTEKADEALLAMTGLKSRMDELEQKDARRGTDETDHRTPGEKFAQSEQVKSLQADPRSVVKARMELKAETMTSNPAQNTAGAAGLLVQPHRLAGIMATPDRRLTVRDLLMAGSTDSNAIEYIRETGFTNGAAAQAKEGDKKAQSDLKFDLQTTSVKTLAHFFKASRQILDDASQLASYINGRLSFGLKLVEEQQLLNGDGLNGNLKGIIPQATAFADPASLAKYTTIDQLRLAMLQAVLAEYPASSHVLNPIDWAKIELTKDDNGRHIIGNPQGVATPTLWGLPVVTTQAMGAGKFLTGAFDLAAQIFDRQSSFIEVGFENDDFTRNLVTILCEERLALAVYRPEALIYGTLADKG